MKQRERFTPMLRRCSHFWFKLALTLLAILILPARLARPATLEATHPTQVVFPGLQPIEVRIRNLINQTQQVHLEATLFQLSSSTAMPAGVRTNRQVRLQSNQTIVEQLVLLFPEVRTPTLFQIRWTTATNEQVGKSLVQVIPADSLKSLNKLVGDQSLGVVDPDDRFKPLLKGKGVEFAEVGESEWAEFAGKVILVVEGPGLSPEFQQSILAGHSRVSLLWLREGKAPLGLPGLSLVRENQKSMAILDFPGLLTETNSAAAQYQLVRAVENLLNPDWKRQILGAKRNP